jgi:Uma2 family endonuclease
MYYPDAILACGKAAAVDLIIEEPSLIVEVTSPSTRATDRREKLDAYLRIPSLREYLIVEQRRRHVLAYIRDAKGEWVREETQGDGDVAVAFLDTRLTLDQIYEDVTLPPLTVREGEEWDEAEWGDYAIEDA